MTPTSRYLIAAEQLQLETRRHYTLLLRPGLWALGGIAVASLLSLVLGSSGFSALVWGLIAGPFLLHLAWKAIGWAVDQIVVTDRRIFEVSGILSRKVAMMPLNRITDLTYNQSLLGRMLGYGELILESAGQDQALNKITHLSHPDDIYRLVTRLSLK
ncbi:MAG: PH domain-containing protein [Egibacteraceae bacterium]